MRILGDLWSNLLQSADKFRDILNQILQDFHDSTRVD